MIIIHLPVYTKKHCSHNDDSCSINLLCFHAEEFLWSQLIDAHQEWCQQQDRVHQQSPQVEHTVKEEMISPGKLNVLAKFDITYTVSLMK